MLTKSVVRTARLGLRIPVRLASGSSNYVVLNSEEKFKEIMSSSGNKILYFTASWCPPCKRIAPVFEKFSKEFNTTTFVKIDVDEFRDLAQEHEISSVPTFKALAGNKVVSQFAGADETALRRSLEQLKN